MDASGTNILVDLFGCDDPPESFLTILVSVVKLIGCQPGRTLEDSFAKSRSSAVLFDKGIVTIFYSVEEKKCFFGLLVPGALTDDDSQMVIDFVRRSILAKTYTGKISVR